MEKIGQYVMVDYASSTSIYQQQYGNYYMGNYYPVYSPMAYPQNYIQQLSPYPYEDYHSGDDITELNQLKRSLGCLNLVETRKKDIDRYQ
jgi:hypothetical protein